MTLRLILTTAALASLSACSQPAENSGNADDFASRVNGGQAAQAANGVQQPSANAPAQGKIAEPAVKPGSTGRMLAPGSETCQAPAAQAFIDQRDTPETRGAIMKAAAEASEIRFLPPGTADQVGPRKDRLNVMIDVTGVIRDLRCG